MIYIKNGTILDPKSGLHEICDILTKDDKILKIGKCIEKEDFFAKLPKEELLEIDASGCIVAPGLVDIHSHFREPGFTEKEDITTGAKAAARGGYTSIVLMANTNPPIDTVETLQYVMQKAKNCAIHIYTCADISLNMAGKQLTDMESLYQEGAVGFTDDGKPILDADLLRKALSKSKEMHVPVSLHEEDPAYIKQNGIHAGQAAAYYHLDGSDRKAEITLVKRDLEIALQVGGCLNIQHISTKEAVDLVRQAKKKGGDIHAEATPHHIALTEEAVIQYGTLAKVNPPLRTEEDRMAIIQGLQDGTIDLIATDHAPHTKEEKEKAFQEAPSGMIGLETALPVLMTELIEKKQLSIMQLLEKLTYNPAKLYRLNAGFLAEGGPADIIIFDPNKLQTFQQFCSKSNNTPFAGKTFKSEVEYTISGGKIAYIKEMTDIDSEIE